MFLVHLCFFSSLQGMIYQCLRSCFFFLLAGDDCSRGSQSQGHKSRRQGVVLPWCVVEIWQRRPTTPTRLVVSVATQTSAPLVISVSQHKWYFIGQLCTSLLMVQFMHWIRSYRSLPVPGDGNVVLPVFSFLTDTQTKLKFINSLILMWKLAELSLLRMAKIYGMFNICYVYWSLLFSICVIVVGAPVDLPRTRNHSMMTTPRFVNAVRPWFAYSAGHDYGRSSHWYRCTGRLGRQHKPPAPLARLLLSNRHRL